MTLTVQQIYDRYSVRDFCQKVEVKRRLSDDSYEADWQDIEELSGVELFDNSVSNVSYQIANNNYNFGIVNVGNMTIKLNSKNGQFDDESNSSSIFFGYVRHGSLIRVKQGYVDKYTDSSNPEDVLVEVFQGFIDDTSNSTKVDDNNLIQSLYCVDLLNFLLKKYTVADMGSLSSTTIETLVYEIMNRSEFTDFITVDSGNIDAGYNATSFDVSQYEGQTQLLSLFEDLSIGNSFFYVRNSTFYFQPVFTGVTSTLTVDERKLIKFSGYDSGISKVYEVFVWSDEPTITYESSPNKYNRSQTIDIGGITNNTQRQNMIEYIGSIARVQRREFSIEIPFFPNIFILDKITIVSPQIIPSDAFIWGVSNWGEDRWRKSLQADNIPSSAEWLVREINHSNSKTKIKVQEIV